MSHFLEEVERIPSVPSIPPLRVEQHKSSDRLKSIKRSGWIFSRIQQYPSDLNWNGQSLGYSFWLFLYLKILKTNMV